MGEFDVFSPELDDVLAAIDLHRLHGISFQGSRLQRSCV
jgi:hypothetical protein